MGCRAGKSAQPRGNWLHSSNAASARVLARRGGLACLLLVLILIGKQQDRRRRRNRAHPIQDLPLLTRIELIYADKTDKTQPMFFFNLLKVLSAYISVYLRNQR